MRWPRAFTLMEVLIASVLLAMACIAILQSILAGQMQSHESLNHVRALALVEAMMDEVIAASYSDPDAPVSPSDRSQFVLHDHYHGYTEAQGAVADAQGQAYPAIYERFARSVTVADTTRDVPGMGGVVPGKLITVTVTDDRGMQWRMNRFIPDEES